MALNTETEYTQSDTLRLGIERPQPRRRGPMDEGAAVLKSDLAPFARYLEQPDGRVLNQVLEGLYDAVLITESGGNARILFANGRAEDFFQCSSRQMVGRSVIEFISGAEEATVEWIRSHLARQRVFIECYCVGTDDYIFPAEITISVLSYTVNDSNYSAFCFFIRNVTARKNAEEELERMSEKMVRSAHYAGMAEIATGVIHDVGNILNSINVSCEVMRDTIRFSQLGNFQKVNTLLHQHKGDLAEFLTSDPKGRLLPRLYNELGQTLDKEYTKLAQELANLSRSINLVRDVITTQQERTSADALREECEVIPLVEDALKLQNANIASHGVTVERHFERDLPLVLTERTKVIYILVNLIKNGVEAMLDKPVQDRCLTLTARREEDALLIGVRDTGGGISPEDQQKIFAHGFSTKDNGHGFGLHASANYLSEMGGSIEFDSPGNGAGTEFRVRLPLHPDLDATQKEATTNKTETKSLRK